MMANGHEWSQFYFTDAGRVLRTEAIANKRTVHFSYAMVGEGKPENPIVVPAMKRLVTPVYPALVKRSFAREYNHIMVIEINNHNPTVFERELLVTEVGVFARFEEDKEGSEILYGYAYCQLGDIQMPPGASQNRTHQLVFDTKLSNATGVTITYDGSAVYMSHDEFNLAMEAHNTDPKAHPDLRDASKIKQSAIALPEGVDPNVNNALGTLNKNIVEIEKKTKDASIKTKGIVQLISATDSDSESEAATPLAVKTVADKFVSPQLFLFAFTAGWSDGLGSSCYWINQFNEVTILLSALKTSNIANGDKIAVLPEGFGTMGRASQAVVYANEAGITTGIGNVDVYPNGDIIAGNPPANSRRFSLCVTFVSLVS